MNYKNKYLKYKNKYLSLRMQYGGLHPAPPAHPGGGAGGGVVNPYEDEIERADAAPVPIHGVGGPPTAPSIPVLPLGDPPRGIVVEEDDLHGPN